jgi:aspartyl-tRNA(Asn)/glutamyl-tRNA(Gln) amidotransferase subunit A
MKCEASRRGALDAYQTWSPEFAERQAAAADSAFRAGIDAGPLQGIPVSAKDLFGIAGLPTYAGTPRVLPCEWQREGPMINRLRRQLGVLVGKTRTVEFAFGGLGTNVHWGAPRNPYDQTRVAGGSSSGAAVSVAEGSALLALGTDTAGSTRIPASMCGLAALKTTKGRWSMDGVVPLSPSLDTPGIIARSARDLGYAFDALDTNHPETVHRQRAAIPASAMKLAVPETYFWRDCEAGIAEVAHAACKRIVAAGARVDTLELPGVEEAYGMFRAGGLAAPELDRFLADELPEWRATLDPAVKRRMDAGGKLSARDYLHRRARLQVLSREAATVFEHVDAVLTPTVAITPPQVDGVATPATYDALNLLALRNTAVVNYLGLCAVTIPVGLDAKTMPVGLQLIGAPGDEERVIALAQTIEQLLDWRTPRAEEGDRA